MWPYFNVLLKGRIRRVWRYYFFLELFRQSWNVLFFILFIPPLFDSCFQVDVDIQCILSGFNHLLPYLNPAFLIVMLVDRERKDGDECSKRYGEAWNIYCHRVKYRMIPYVYWTFKRHCKIIHISSFTISIQT